MYSYKRALTIDYTKNPATQTDFPVLVSFTDATLKTTGNGGHVNNANGYDIAFYSDSALTTQLDHEIEAFNATTGAIVMWVRIPSLSHTANTVFYIAYGDSGISTSQEDKNGVWNSNYEGVYHLKTGSPIDKTDSTANANNGTSSTNPTSSTGKIDGGATFNSNNVDCAISYNLYPVSLSFWFKNSNSDASFRGIVSNYLSGSLNGYQVFKNWSTLYFWYFNGGSGSIYGGGNGMEFAYGAAADNNWHHVVVTVNSSGAIAYFDGSSNATKAWSGTAGVCSPSRHLFMGVYDAAYLGDLDEVRISDVALTANWVTTEYNNTGSPSTFMSVGSETATAALRDMLGMGYIPWAR